MKQQQETSPSLGLHTRTHTLAHALAHSHTPLWSLKSSLIEGCVDEGKIWLKDKVLCTEAFRDIWVLECAAGKNKDEVLQVCDK